jgi:hypothetical protein
MPGASLYKLAILLLLALAWNILVPPAAKAEALCGVPEARGDWPVETQVEAGIDPGISAT